MSHAQTAVLGAPQGTASSRHLTNLRPALQPLRGQPLPFRIRLVRTEDQLAKAVGVRASAYGRHVPALGAVLKEPEDVDRDDSTVIFLAESKEDGSPVGTLRTQTNLRGGPLALERSVCLPARFRGRPLAGVTRLAVKEGSAGKQVKLALFKTLFRYCFATQIEWILIGARPPLDAQYLSLGFEDLFPGEPLIPFATAGNVLHRVLGFEVFCAERKWFETNHRLYRFMAQDYHPDIEIFSSVNPMWSRPRRDRTEAAPLRPRDSLGFALV
jgi:hypothetical protein